MTEIRGQNYGETWTQGDKTVGTQTQGDYAMEKQSYRETKQS